MGKILIAQLNEKQSDYEVLRDAVNLLADQIQKEEKEIDEFKVERINKSAKVIILMGRTGGGKSTFSNRLSGDTSVLGDQGPSIASASCKSVTQENSKQLITFGDHLIAVVDTPGVGDSYGRDREHSNRLCAYLKGCGGINAFVVVCNGACPRFDAHFKQMLQQYDLMAERRFGSGSSLSRRASRAMSRNSFGRRTCSARSAFCSTSRMSSRKSKSFQSASMATSSRSRTLWRPSRPTDSSSNRSNRRLMSCGWSTKQSKGNSMR